MQLDPSNQLDEGDPPADTVIWSADELLVGSVDVIIGPATSAAALTVIDRVTCAGVIMFSPSNGAELFTTYRDHGLYFRTMSSNVFRGPVFADLLATDGNRTVVLLSRDDVWGNDLRQLTAQAIQDAGATALDSFSYNPNTPDFHREVQRVKAHDPDAIIVMGFTESARLLATMAEQGLGLQQSMSTARAT